MRSLHLDINDRGSTYAVTGAPATGSADAKAIVKILCRQKKFAKATHHSWAIWNPQAPLKTDDGEAGAGMVILRMLERAGLRDHVVIVTRWYGGKPLGGDRFRHVQTAVRTYLDAIAPEM
ncbi:MAG: YigZ family protein [Pseudomonadota bacterium]